jgi:hypothetical protein
MDAMSDIAARIVDCLANADCPALEMLYTPDVLLDIGSGVSRPC